jgi:hypothetical protein
MLIVPAVNSSILSKVLTVRGIMVFEFASEVPAALNEMVGYIKDVIKTKLKKQFILC